ncbi:MAG: PilZ domain-containing protein [Desulfobacteraceae bacterium]|jgi:hypothetical protein
MQTYAAYWQHQSHSYRRQYERKDYDVDVVFANDNKVFQGCLKDISLGGAFIMTKHAGQLFEGDVVTISIPFTNGANHVRRSGRIIWKNSTGFAITF